MTHTTNQSFSILHSTWKRNKSKVCLLLARAMHHFWQNLMAPTLIVGGFTHHYFNQKEVLLPLFLSFKNQIISSGNSVSDLCEFVGHANTKYILWNTCIEILPSTRSIPNMYFTFIFIFPFKKLVEDDKKTLISPWLFWQRVERILRQQATKTWGQSQRCLLWSFVFCFIFVFKELIN